MKTTYPYQIPISEHKLIANKRCGLMFGVDDWSIEVPEHLRGKFSEVLPTFKNCEGGLLDCGPQMKAFAYGHNRLKKT